MADSPTLETRLEGTISRAPVFGWQITREFVEEAVKLLVECREELGERAKAVRTLYEAAELVMDESQGWFWASEAEASPDRRALKGMEAVLNDPRVAEIARSEYVRQQPEQPS